tara:strand:- start:1014 stop:1205 length:192 start_codon:yes stop_codon:yes gene_type:complete
MLDKGIEIFRKTKEDLAFAERRLSETTDSLEREILVEIIAKQKAWFAEWDLQNKVTMQNNCKK